MDLETKLAMLKADEDGCRFPDDVARYLAEYATSDRELRGVVVRVVAYASLSGEDITLPLVDKVFSHLCSEGWWDGEGK